MNRLIAVAFALAVATSAQAMSPAPLHQPDGMITQVREACGAGRVPIDGVLRCLKHQAPGSQVCAMEWRRLRSVLLKNQPLTTTSKQEVSLSRIEAFFLPPHLQSSACGRCSWRRLEVDNQGYGAARNFGQP